jgi:lipopolysaccharide exporter
MASVKEKAVSGVKWQMVNKVLQKVISVGTFAVLARMLEPSTFGLFAMAFIAIDGFNTVKSFGLDSALVQRKGGSEKANDTAFFIIQSGAIVLFALSYLLAPGAGAFFKNPEVTSVIRALGVIFIVNGFARVPTSILQKQMKFQSISMIELVGSVVNSAFAISLAFFWPTVWCLVWAHVIKQIVTAFLSRRVSGYRVKWQFDFGTAKELFGFGKFVFGLSLIRYVGSNMNNIIVGRLLGAAQLGFFALAANAGSFINTHFTNLISNVMFPAYSEIRGDQESLRRAYLKTIKFVSMLSFPFSIVLITLAEEFVLTLYGPKWITIVPLIQLFGVLQLFYPIAGCSDALFDANGKPNYVFNMSLFAIFIRIPLVIFLTHTMGIIGVVISLLIMNLVIDPISINLVKRMLKFSWREFFGQLVSSFSCALIMLVAILSFKFVWFGDAETFTTMQSFIRLLVLSVIGGGSYLVAFFLLDRTSSLEVKRMIFKFEGVRT